jgi:hypothetical protein
LRLAVVSLSTLALLSGCARDARQSDETPTGIPVLQEDGPATAASGSMDWDSGVDASGSFVEVTSGEYSVVLRPGDLVARDEFGSVVWSISPATVSPEATGRATVFPGMYGSGVDLKIPMVHRDLSPSVSFSSDPGLPASAVTLEVETVVEHDPAWTAFADENAVSPARTAAVNFISFRSAGETVFHMGLPSAADASRAEASWGMLSASSTGSGVTRVSSGVLASWAAAADYPATLSPRLRTGEYTPLIGTFHLAPAVPGGDTANLAVTYTDQVHNMLDIHINWGDGVVEDFQDNMPVHKLHQYEDTGTYHVLFRITNAAGTAQADGYVDVVSRSSQVGPGYEFSTIQAAIDAAPATNWKISVHPGTYYESLDLLGKSIQIVGVGPRDSVIVDGGDAERVVNANSGETLDTILEGMSFTNGREGNGGALLVEDSSALTVTNCEFRDNYADSNGGAVFVNNSSNLVMSDSYLGGNYSDYDGGAVVVEGGSQSTFQNCVFDDNYADDDAGALDVDNDGGSSSAVLIGCTFSDNESDDEGGALRFYASSGTVTNCAFTGSFGYDDGGAVIVDDLDDPAQVVHFTDCLFENNESDDAGGAVHFEGGGSDSPPITFTNCVFRGNYAPDDDGGAVCIWSNSVSFFSCEFDSNTTDDDGGAINSEGDHLIVQDCVFTRNTGDDGGAIKHSQGTLSVSGSTFGGNHARYEGGGMDIWNGTSSVTLTASFFCGNVADADSLTNHIGPAGFVGDSTSTFFDSCP